MATFKLQLNVLFSTEFISSCLQKIANRRDGRKPIALFEKSEPAPCASRRLIVLGLEGFS